MVEATEKNTKVINSVNKALDVLELISKHEEGLTVTEISQALQQSPSATYHLLNTLKSRYYLHQNNTTKKYTLGMQLYLLCPSNDPNNFLLALANDHMQALTEQYNENCNLLIFEGSNVKYVAQTECKQILRMFTTIGATVPFYCTGGGKAMFAFLPIEKQQELLTSTSFEPFTKHTILDEKHFLAEVQKAKDSYIAFDMEERELGVVCIASPVLDANNNPIAAISMSCPKSRLDDKKKQDMVTSIRATAKKITAILNNLS